jgi:hypothetical protein
VDRYKCKSGAVVYLRTPRSPSRDGKPVSCNVRNATSTAFQSPRHTIKALGATIRNLLKPFIILSHNLRTLVQLVVQSLTVGKFQGPLIAMIDVSTLALLNAGTIISATGLGQGSTHAEVENK